MYEALTASYNQSNKKTNEAIKEKLFSYVILDKNFNETEDTGILRSATILKRMDIHIFMKLMTVIYQKFAMTIITHF